MIDMIIRIVVVFPAPFGPMKPTSSPLPTRRSIPSTATFDPKVFRTLLTVIASPTRSSSAASGRRSCRFLNRCSISEARDSTSLDARRCVGGIPTCNDWAIGTRTFIFRPLGS